MASALDICNTALSRIGDIANVSSISPPEGSVQAQYCARFYPIALNTLLESHPWSFASRRALLAEKATDPWGWVYAYVTPADAIRIVSVLPATARNDSKSEYYDTLTDADGQVIIVTNLAEASALYTFLVNNPAQFPPLFVDALSWLLASYLAGPIIKGDAGDAKARSCYQMYLMTLGQARSSNANQRQLEQSHVPEWISKR